MRRKSARRTLFFFFFLSPARSYLSLIVFLLLLIPHPTTNSCTYLAVFFPPSHSLQLLPSAAGLGATAPAALFEDDFQTVHTPSSDHRQWQSSSDRFDRCKCFSAAPLSLSLYYNTLGCLLPFLVGSIIQFGLIYIPPLDKETEGLGLLPYYTIVSHKFHSDPSNQPDSFPLAN